MTDVSRVLLIEDDPGDAVVVHRHLRDARRGRFSVDCIDNLTDLRFALVRHRPQVLLCDLTLPDATGLDVVHAAGRLAPGLPVVVLTGADDEALGIEALHYGAQDYLVKGRCAPDQLERALTYAIERKRLVRQIEAGAMYDVLTGLPSRELLFDRLSLALARGVRDFTSVVVAAFALDDVSPALPESVYGTLLSQIAQRLRSGLEPTDTIARVGPGTFAVLLDGVRDTEQAEATLERLFERVSMPVLVLLGEIPQLTALDVRTVVGHAASPGDADTAEALLAAARQACDAARDLTRRPMVRFSDLGRALRRVRASNPPR